MQKQSMQQKKEERKKPKMRWGQKAVWRPTSTTHEATNEKKQSQVQQAGMSTNLQNNIFTNLAMEEENTTTIEEENHKENTSKESQYKLEHQGK